AGWPGRDDLRTLIAAHLADEADLLAAHRESLAINPRLDEDFAEIVDSVDRVLNRGAGVDDEGVWRIPAGSRLLACRGQEGDRAVAETHGSRVGAANSAQRAGRHEDKSPIIGHRPVHRRRLHSRDGGTCYPWRQEHDILERRPAGGVAYLEFLDAQIRTIS